MTATQLIPGQTYQLTSLPMDQRKDGVIYLSGTRTFKLLTLDEDVAWIKCTESGKRFVVKADRLRSF